MENIYLGEYMISNGTFVNSDYRLIEAENSEDATRKLKEHFRSTEIAYLKRCEEKNIKGTVLYAVHRVIK